MFVYGVETMQKLIKGRTVLSVKAGSAVSTYEAILFTVVVGSGLFRHYSCSTQFGNRMTPGEPKRKTQY